MHVAGAVIAWLVPLILLTGTIGMEWKRKYPDVHLSDYVQADTFAMGLIVLSFCVWIIPLGWLLALPLAGICLGILTIYSENSRKMWVQRWKPRSLLVIAIVIGVMISGISSVSEPVGAPDWGEPILTENSDAPAWPASEQHTWVVTEGILPTDFTILVVNHIRFPGAYSAYGSGSCVLWWIEFSDADDLRLKQSIETLLDKTNQPSSYTEHFSLDTISSGETHEYDSATLPYSQKFVVIDLFGETKVAEVITVAQGDWGGEVHLLTMIKPMIGFDTPFYADNDPYGAKYVDAWLNSQP
ncbi:MAG: hypothetical protein QF440_06090 [Candidatus Thalassarchaeaceae archaeon]|jgi:hypothetical protein|nr:hypothetical protein [Candidatus Thalassarchaeaceae archaeon]